MKAFINQMLIQFKMDFRDKDVVVIYYLVPLAFYLIMGVILNTLSDMMDNPFILTTTVFAITMTAYLGLPNILVKIKEKGVLKAYKVAGIPALALPLIQVIITVIHILLVSIIILLTAPLVFKVPLPQNIGLHFFGVIVIGLGSSALGVLLSSFVKSQSSMTMYGQILFMPSILFTGLMFPAEFLPKPLKLIGDLFPASLGLNMLGGEDFQILPLSLLILISAIAFIISIILYRRIVKEN
ncbi:MAG: ABC transporter permease [Peptostreptococcales bacterium]